MTFTKEPGVVCHVDLYHENIINFKVSLQILAEMAWVLHQADDAIFALDCGTARVSAIVKGFWEFTSPIISSPRWED